MDNAAALYSARVQYGIAKGHKFMGEFSALVTDPSAGGLDQLAAWKDTRVVACPGEGDEGENGGEELESEGEEEEGESDTETEGRTEVVEEEGTRENGDMPTSTTDAGSLQQETETNTLNIPKKN